MKRTLSVTAFFVYLVSAAFLFAADTNRLTVDLFLDWETVSSPQISPDSKKILYIRRWTDKLNDRYVSEVWMMNIDGSHKEFLFKGSSPVWSPSGDRIAYLAEGEPKGSQIHIFWMDTRRSTQITHLDIRPSGLRWSPDGKRLAFVATVPEKSRGMAIKLPKRPKGAKWAPEPRIITRLNYRRDGRGYLPSGYRHIFIVDAEGGTPQQLTTGPYNDGTPVWTPDGTYLIFSGLRMKDWEYAWRESEIYRVNTTTGEVTQLTHRKGPDYAPVVSPNGRWIAYLGYDRNDDTYNVPDLYIMDFNGQKKKILTASFDRRPSSVQWAPDSRGLFFLAQDRGTRNLYFVDLDGNVKQITRGKQVLSSLFIHKKGLIAAVRSSFHEPGDIVLFTRKNPVPQKLTAVNDDLLKNIRLGEVEEIWYSSTGGVQIQGWIVKPPDFDPSQKYPLILYIHGGPHAMYSVAFNFEFQNHAANGYVVLYTNPRGSSGYGKKFGNAIKNNYPGPDYDDLMNGVDEVLKRGYIDANNLFVCGGSGGGVLTSWIIGHTDRFAAAVVMKPVTNWFSFVGTTDGFGWYYNFKKLPWEDPEEHLWRSPLMYVGNVKTPTLLLTGELDLRTPMEQTEQYYRALKLRKVETAMIRIADEYHGIGRRHPSNKIRQILYLRSWFDRHRR